MESDLAVRDFVTLQRGLTYKGPLVGKPGPALLGLGSIVPGGGFRPDFKTYGGECPPHLMLAPGDLYVSLKGATKDGEMIGSVARVPETVASGRLTQDTVGLKFHDDSTDSRSYLYWCLRTPQYRDYCRGHATGSAVVALSRDDFLNYPIPPLTPARLRLVELFEAIEGKIELNRRMNATLEGIARALFKSWFIDFDPVHAKAAGKHPPGLDKPIADLFPDSFEDSKLGPIPKGWAIGKFDEIAELNGWTLSSRDSLETIDYIEISEVSRGDVGQITRYARGDEPSRARRRLRHGDVLLSTVRPDRGSYLLCLDPAESLIASTGFVTLTARNNTWAFVYAAATQDEIGAELGRIADGGAYPAVRPEVVGSLEVVLPHSEQVPEAFQRLAAPLLSRADSNRKEALELSSVRDSLLPRLLGGVETDINIDRE